MLRPNSRQTKGQISKGDGGLKGTCPVNGSAGSGRAFTITPVVGLGRQCLAAESTAEEQQAWRDAALAADISSLNELDFAGLEQAVYTHFGCKTELRQFAKDAKGALAFLNEVVPMSLTEQHERLLDLIDELGSRMVEHGCPPNKHFEEWDLAGLRKGYHDMFDIDATGVESMSDAEQMAQKLYADAEAVLEKREREIGELLYLRIFRNLFLQEIDNQWLEHLQDMDSLREGIGLRGYGQRDPKKEYQKEGFEHFQQLMANIKGSVVHKMFHFVLEGEDEVRRLEEQRRAKAQARQQRMQASHAVTGGGERAGDGASSDSAAPGGAGGRRQAAPSAAPQRPSTVKRERPKVGRNDPCWCGSGKKYKQCHLKSDEASVGM